MSEEYDIPAEIEKVEATIERAADVQKLINTKLFKKVITEGFIETFGHNCVANRIRLTPAQLETNNAQLTGISVFQSYIANVLAAGGSAEAQLKELKAEQERYNTMELDAEGNDPALYDSPLER